MLIHTHSLRGRGLAWWQRPPTQETLSSVPTLSYILTACGQLCCKSSIRFSGLSPEPKMPSSGKKLKSHWHREVPVSRGSQLHRHEQETGQRKPGRPSEHHRTLCRYLRAGTLSSEWLGRPQRSNYTERNPNKSPSPRSFHALLKLLLESPPSSGLYTPGRQWRKSKISGIKKKLQRKKITEWELFIQKEKKWLTLNVFGVIIHRTHK